jgi:phosphoglycolate phosphatase
MKRLNLLFDLDGTLTDSREAITHSIQYALEQVGVTGIPAEDLSWCVGPPLVDSLDKLLGPDRIHLAPHALEYYQRRYQEVGIFENRPYDGIQECLLELEKFADLYVATSNLTRFSKQILDQFSLAGHFRRIHGCEDWSGAEKSRIIADLMRLERLHPDTTIMIGDRHHDIRAAQENRLPSVGVLWGYGGRVELTLAGADFVLTHPRELTECFKTDRPADPAIESKR